MLSGPREGRNKKASPGFERMESQFSPNPEERPNSRKTSAERIRAVPLSKIETPLGQSR